MTRQSTVLVLFVGGILGASILAMPGWGQDRGAKPEAGGNPGEGQASGAKKPGRWATEISDPDFSLWRRKAQLELDVLQAQLEAKKAEITLREAEHRARKLGRDVSILAKLEMRDRMSFAEATPLEDVLKHVKKITTGPDDNGIPIYVDPVGLQEAGATMSSPVTIDLEGISLSTNLRLVLKQLGLEFQVGNGLLTITSPEGLD